MYVYTPCVDGRKMAALGGAQCKGKGRRGAEKVGCRTREAEEDGEERENLQNPASARGRYAQLHGSPALPVLT